MKNGIGFKENKLNEDFDVLLKELKLKIEALKNQRSSIIAQNHAMEAELLSLTRKIKQKNSLLEISKKEYDWSEKKLEKSKLEYKSLKQKGDFMIGELKHLEPTVSDAKRKRAELKTTNNFLQHEFSTFKSQIRVLKDKIKHARLQDQAVIVE